MSNLISQIENAEQRFEKAMPVWSRNLETLQEMEQGADINWVALDEPARLKARLERLGRFIEADAVGNLGPVAFNPLERILDSNELTGVEFLERGLVAARAVARVQIRDSEQRVIGYGTGTMISSRLFITNNHVLRNAHTASISTIQFDYISGLNGDRDPISFRLVPAEFFITNETLDFSIIAVEQLSSTGVAVESRGWSPLIPISGKATVGERVNIIQHPGGERMQVAIRDNKVINVVDSFLHYRADTQPGSSGSPVFNEQWEMAALHHAGKPKRDSMGRILLVDGTLFNGDREQISKIDWEANEGIRISEIVRHVASLHLSGVKKALWEQTISPPPITDVWSLSGSHRMESGEAKSGSRPANGVYHDLDENGHPSWLFRLSFAPVDTAPIPPASAQLPSSTANTVQIVDQNSSGNVADASRSATDLIERFGHTGLYYDEAEDTLASESYWDGVDMESPSATLFPLLQNHLKETHRVTLSYRRARHEFLYPAIDLHPDGKLKNIYSGIQFNPVEAIASELAALLPFAEAMGMETTSEALPQILNDDALWEDFERSAALAFNCEHVVCQSWFEKRQPMKADVHHLFACQPGCNSFRSNIPYWQFDPTEEVVREECGRREQNKFEPEHGKGAVARATMYFLMRYPGELGDQSGEMPKNRTRILLDWHNSHPVDEYEKHRNWLIEKAQGNRNPFIDFPEIASAALIERGFG